MSMPMKVSEVAAFLRIHPQTLKRIPTSELPYYRIGSRGDRRYETKDVVAYKNARREA